MTSHSKQRQRGNRYRNDIKKRKRELDDVRDIDDPDVTRRVKGCAKRKKNAAVPLHAQYTLPQSVNDPANHVARSAFVGKLYKSADTTRRPISREEAEARGLECVDWDGK